MRVFVSTGEASGSLAAADLIEAMRALHAGPLDAEGIGDERLAAAGVTIVRGTRGWASLGLVEALARIPKLYAAMWSTALRIVRRPPDLIVLVDFGAFNVRLARTVRRLGCATPILYYFPPSAWLDRPGVARAVAALCDPLTAFAHQRDFYRSLGLPIGYVGHPLVSRIAPRSPRPAPPAGGGHVALLPGSRGGEIARHTTTLLDAFAQLLARRPALRGTLVAAGADARAAFETALAMRSPLPVEIASDARAVLADADVAAVASGTAVLEAALLATPVVAFYRLGEAQARIARRVYHGRFITLPNLVLDEPLVPELLQDAFAPAPLADALAALLDDSSAQRDGFVRLRSALGPPDALERCARFALTLAAERAPVA